jgi:hypothetical protein
MTFFLHTARGTFDDGGFWSFGIQSSGSVSEASAESTWAAAVSAFFGDANVKTYYSTGTTLTQTSTSTASATFRQTTITRTGHSVAGTSTAAQLPTVLGVVATWYTANATRFGRGRIFLPAPAVTALGTGLTGHLDPTVAGNIKTALATLFASMSAGGLTQILYTRKETRSGVPADTTSQVTGRVLQGKIHVQRRRSDKIIAPTY